AVAILPSIAATETAVPTPTHTPTPDYTPTPGPSPTASNTPTKTPVPTNTPAPSATPTIVPQFDPVLLVTEPVLREDLATPATAVPTPVPTFEVENDNDFTNILLLGSDEPLGNGEKSDTIIIVSINRAVPSASMISIPRDLYVYIPGRNMGKINTATFYGVETLKQTILYNFGIPIHYYARVDFAGFENVVDAMDGVDIPVSCEFRGWQLSSPELDPEDADNWEVVTLEPAFYHMDGSTALWYVRSRKLSPLGDFDRGRRQQQVLRAMFNQGIDLGLVTQAPTLWSTYRDSVETDLDIGRILQLASLAPSIRENGIQNLYLAGKTQPWSYTTQDGVEISAHLPIWEGDDMMAETFSRLYKPPTLNRAIRAPITVEIVNATGNPDMALLAADNLAWYGFTPIISEAQPETTENVATMVTYYGPNFKGSFNELMAFIFNIRTDQIGLNSEDDLSTNYRIILGADYNPCVENQLFFNPN
ncbi:MAG: LCP family protein, partial [Anaerolineales bacterium]|nr:LCP family protein [Anaerolineales bacterium]